MQRKNYESDDERFSADAYTIKGYRGVAWRVLGWETEPGETEWWDATGGEDGEGEMVLDDDPEPVRTGRVVARMVGDDHRFTFDESDLTPLTREEYCGECGQIGCGHDGLDRSDADA